MTSTPSSLATADVTSRRAWSNVLDVNRYTSCRRDPFEMAAVAGDHRVAAPYGAFDDRNVNDVRMLGTGGECTDPSGQLV